MLWQWVLQGQAGVEQCLRGAPGYLLQENGREVSCSLAMTRTASRYECISVEFTEQNCSPVLPSNQLWIIKEELNIVSRPVTSQNTVHCIDWNLQQIAILELRNELSIWSKDVIQTKLFIPRMMLQLYCQYSYDIWQSSHFFLNCQQSKTLFTNFEILSFLPPNETSLR